MEDLYVYITDRTIRLNSSGERVNIVVNGLFRFTVLIANGKELYRRAFNEPK